MPVPVSAPVWWGSLLWLVGVGASSFGVAWLSGTRLRIRRALYIPLLALVTGGLTAGYVAWLGVGVEDVVLARWGWGLLAAGVAGLVLGFGVIRQPATRRLERRDLPEAVVWEGIVYGTAEGVLLSALPVLMTWQLLHSLGWAGTAGAVARWTLPVLASAAVIVVHHLGYWNCRNRILVPITWGCSLLAVGYLVTASMVAPTLGHILLHFAADAHGVEMPPVDRPEGSSPPLEPTGPSMRAA
ncbi:MAG: hypothetical protein KGJ77_09115 [Acidobacteriota bacterium]|nr:hypothetical protein [Acidobacteriota bacterium]